MPIDRRALITAGLTATAAAARAQTPPPMAAGKPPAGLPQPLLTLDLWPRVAPKPSPPD